MYTKMAETNLAPLSSLFRLIKTGGKNRGNTVFQNTILKN